MYGTHSHCRLTQLRHTRYETPMQTLKGLIAYFFGSRNAWLRTAIIALVLGSVFSDRLSPSSLFFGSKQEIMYHGQFEDLDCIRPTFCFMRYVMQVGNTGKQDQSLVRVRLSNVPPYLRGMPRFMKISSSRSPTADPQLSVSVDGWTRTYELSPLSAGAMVRLEFFRRKLQRADADRMRNVRVDVEAVGRVLEGDPKVTAFGRILRALFFWVPIR